MLTEMSLKAPPCKSDSYLFLFRPLPLLSSFSSKNFINRQISDAPLIQRRKGGDRQYTAY